MNWKFETQEINDRWLIFLSGLIGIIFGFIFGYGFGKM